MINYSIIGKRFGKLVVVELDHVNNGTYWRCKCDCGREKIIRRGQLTSGDTISCGCYWEEKHGTFGLKHGMSKSKLYAVWSGMVQRCTNPKASNYYRYGGRGITICDEWRTNSKAFFDWAIANGYSEGLTIERVDNSGSYCPENCRWVGRVTQQNNTRRNHFVTWNGVTHSIAEWSRLLGINHATLRYRVNHGNMKDFEQLPYSELITGKVCEV